jgi:large subunit ribosomal protein L35
MATHCGGKTHKGILKRLKVTGTGKIVRRKGGKSHLLSTKSGKRLRRLARTATVPHHVEKQVKRQLIK